MTSVLSEQLSAEAAPTVGVPGSIIIPAHNEASVISRALDALAPGVIDGDWQLLVVCNGCSDSTSDVARSYSGVEVIELPAGSKPAALNAGDAAAVGTVRVYLDADVQITAEAARALIEALSDESGVLTGRPPFRYDTVGSSALVKAFYRARDRISSNHVHLWGAGVYALNATARARFIEFPMIIADDLYVDAQFTDSERLIVETDPVVVSVPRTARCLLSVLRRTYRGNAELAASAEGTCAPPDSSLRTLSSLVRSVSGVASFVDAIVYATFVLSARIRLRGQDGWARDESARATDVATHESSAKARR